MEVPESSRQLSRPCIGLLKKKCDETYKIVLFSYWIILTKAIHGGGIAILQNNNNLKVEEKWRNLFLIGERKSNIDFKPHISIIKQSIACLLWKPLTIDTLRSDSLTSISSLSGWCWEHGTADAPSVFPIPTALKRIRV